GSFRPAHNPCTGRSDHTAPENAHFGLTSGGRKAQATRWTMGRGTVVNAWRALILVGLLLFDPPAHGASLTRQCRRACRDEIAACVASGGERGPCSRQTRRRCQQQGLQVCLAAGESLGRTNSLSSLVSPSLATGLTASPVGCSQIYLAWTASTDTGGSGLEGYNVYVWRNYTWTFLKQVLAPATSTSDTGLTGSSTYYYAVSAVDGAGNQS